MQDIASLNNLLIMKVKGSAQKPGKFQTEIEGLSIARCDAPETFDSCFYVPSVSVLLQGRKESVIGNETIHYGALDCLVSGIEVPSKSQVIDANPETPLLSLSLEINQELVIDIASGMSSSSHQGESLVPGVSVASVQPDVFDVFIRLVDLLDNPEKRELLAPLLIRELMVRVLTGPQGGALSAIYQNGSHNSQVASAINWLKQNYMHGFKIEELASRVNMATSTFHRQFKQITSISPLQYQKRLRLYEAQRLMLVENINANSAATQVGYDSAQQFNREYKRLYGEPPHRSIALLRSESLS